MIDVLKSKSRLLSLLLVVAVLLAYMPGLATNVYGEDGSQQGGAATTVIELTTGNPTAVNTAINNANLGIYVNYSDSSSDYCQLTLSNGLDRPDLYFSVNVGESKELDVYVEGEVTIGGITMNNDTKCKDVRIRRSGNSAQRAVLNAVDEISLSAKTYGGDFYVEDIDVNTDNFELDIEFPESSSSIFYVYGANASVNADSMNIDFASSGATLHLETIHSRDNLPTYNLGSFSTNAGTTYFDGGIYNIGNLTTTGSGDAFTINGANVKTEGVKAWKLVLKDGTFEMDAAKSEIDAIDFESPFNITQLGAGAYTDYISENNNARGLYTIESIKSDGEKKLAEKTSGIVRFGKGYNLTLGAIDTTKVKDLTVENLATEGEVKAANNVQVSSFTPVKFKAQFDSLRKVSKVYVNGVETQIYGGKYRVESSGMREKYTYEGYIVLGNVTTDQAITFDFATPSAVCEVNFHYQGQIINTEILESGDTLDASEITQMLGAVGLEFNYYKDAARTQTFDLNSPITADTDIYLAVVGSKLIKGSINVEPLKTCKEANFYALAKEYGHNIIRNADGTVFMMPGFSAKMLFVAPKTSDGSIDWGNGTMMPCDVSETAASPFTDQNQAYFVMYRVQPIITGELADDFKFMCGNQELKKMSMGRTSVYLVPIEFCSHEFGKIATTGSALEYYECGHCDRIYRNDGGNYTPVADSLSSETDASFTCFADEYTVDEEGNYVFTLTEDLIYGATGANVVNGNLIIDLNGHKLYFSIDTSAIGATGDVIIKNGTIDMSRIKAANLILDNAECKANLFYKGSAADHAYITSSITLQNGAVLISDTKAVHELDDGITIEIKDTSKIVFSEDSEALLSMQMMGKSDVHVIVNEALLKQIKKYLPSSAKAGTFDEIFDLSKMNMDPNEIEYMRQSMAGMYLIEAPVAEFAAKNWPASSGKHSNDSSKVTVETTTTENTDGSKTTTATASDGSTSTTVTDASGAAKTETAISEKAVEEAVKENKPVTVPMESAAATIDTAKAQEVKINLPAGTEKAKVEIPVKDVSPSVVAVLVKADGTEEIITKTMMSEDGIVAEVKNGETIKIVDNHKEFTDTANHWAKDDIDFITARGVFNGTGKGKFDANGDMTRGMLMTVMARYDGVDASGKDWQEKGAAWAKENGISDGTKLDAKVSRADLVTMLWRYAGSPVVNDANTAAFNDADKVKDYAKLAMEWAVKAGLIEGNAGSLDPEGSAQRGQLAAIMHRFMVFMESK